MTRAILISGNALRFTQETSAFKHYLLGDVDIGSNALLQFHGCHVPVKTVLARIAEAARQKSAYPLFIHFAGHGHEQGWWFDDANSLPYIDLAETFCGVRRQVLLVNDCDHAMAALPTFRLGGVYARKVALIGACESDEKRDPFLGDWLRRNWRRRRPNRLSDTLRWGPSLDHHFYPSHSSEG